MIPTGCSKYQGAQNTKFKKQNSIKRFNILIYFMTATANRKEEKHNNKTYDNENTQL